MSYEADEHEAEHDTDDFDTDDHDTHDTDEHETDEHETDEHKLDEPLQRKQSALNRIAKMSAFLLFAVLATALLFVSAKQEQEPMRNLVYWTGQHQDVPSGLPEMDYVSHVALAFMQSSLFNEFDGVKRTEWPLFTTVGQARARFAPGTKVLVAIGGWGETAAFSIAARSEQSRKRFARNVAAMVTATDADGVDIDWEYPGGNGEDYKQITNDEKAWEIYAYPLLLAEIRSALGRDKIISAAVPGKPEDMLAFTRLTVPRIMNSVDFLNVMTYDLMNRRNTVTTHHAGVENSLAAIDAYIAAGASPQRLNLGFAYYVKYFKTEHDDCQEMVNQGKAPIGCRTLLMEDPGTGKDMGRAGAFSWDDAVPSRVKSSYNRAMKEGVYDEVHGGHYYWDSKEDLWWTFETPLSIATKKFPLVVMNRRLGGVFAWGVGEDAPLYRHFKTLSHVMELIRSGEGKALSDEL
ncbi:class 5 chitinase 1 [Grosmannia clavigera kw1407]|uniref:chitinase n=1 Tax=Grosmannia clavigera (strain kw1407 / UAMH 11150) TaxID=655863 RepID=F0X9V2_GROCL|nr:class 5 chitinase 1 [Grosmannia clavigera kw1407]EFX05557.1 class 5 chitinase 1 [Grosmannia clavigera kw1407]